MNLEREREIVGVLRWVPGATPTLRGRASLGATADRFGSAVLFGNHAWSCRVMYANRALLKRNASAVAPGAYVFAEVHAGS